MTHSDWLAYREPGPMLGALGDLASPRKLRLFACACCRRLESALPHLWNPATLEVAERFADGLASEEELREARRRVGEDLHAAYRRIEIETRGPRHPRDVRASALMEAEFSALRELSAATDTRVRAHALGRDAAQAFGGASAALALRSAVGDWEVRDTVFDAMRAEEVAQADLVRDLFTDRFWFVVPDPAWFTSDVMTLAHHIYERRAFEHMPILADALQDAGCDSDELLCHCRAPDGSHVRGCWVVDLVLGKV